MNCDCDSVISHTTQYSDSLRIVNIFKLREIKMIWFNLYIYNSILDSARNSH